MMTSVRSLVLGVAVLSVLTFGACEKQPVSKIRSIEETIFHHGGHGEGHGDGHGDHAHGSHDKEAKGDDHGKKDAKAEEKAGETPAH